ncbi:MAG: helix-turn-helix domain-containing protein [Terriglobia bacterium]
MLTLEERTELERWTRSGSTPPNLVFRAALILDLADGLSYREIERRHGASARTISLWKQRFLKERLAGLQGRHKGSQPRASTPYVRTQVIEAYQKLPNSGRHSSGRTLARQLGLDKSTVQRILSGVRPQTGGMDQLMAAFDPQFSEKAVEIIGLYLDPPQYAAVFVVREGTANQESIPVERRGFHLRHASEELYSALVGCKGAEQHPSVPFTDLLASLVQKEGWAPEIHIVHYNLEAETEALSDVASASAQKYGPIRFRST